MLLVLAGCGYDRGSGPLSQASTVTVSVASTDPMTATGETRLATAVVKDAYGPVIPAPSLSWRTSAPAVATVEGTGSNATVTAVHDGTANITASSGSVEGMITVTVRRRVVSIELSAPDSVVVAGSTTQLTVVGRDARDHAITGLAGVRFATSNPFSVQVSAFGLVTALFSSFRPFSSIITATLVRDGMTLSATKRIDVGDAAPPGFGFSGLMEPEGVRPEPVLSASEGVVFLRLDGEQVHYRILWSLLEGPPLSAHIHGPDGSDAVADVLVDLALGNPTNTSGTFSGSFSAEDIHPQGRSRAIALDSLVTLMGIPGMAYADIHTAFFRDGALRGAIFPRKATEASLWRIRETRRRSRLVMSRDFLIAMKLVP
jgi:hypothetical protein